MSIKTESFFELPKVFKAVSKSTNAVSRYGNAPMREEAGNLLI